MKDVCTIQIFDRGHWLDVGIVDMVGGDSTGWRARTLAGYDLNWALEHMDARDAHAFSCQYPVRVENFKQDHWPVFLIDILPQGYGRAELLRRLALPEAAAESADWSLLLHGSGNPIGNMRIKEAAEWLSQQTNERHGFQDAEVSSRGDEFTEYLAQHGLFVAGSSGVQGEWPKLLMTRAVDGLLYLDHTLPDNEAQAHYIIKFGRGNNARLEQILQHEPVYMTIAHQLGLHVHADLSLRGRALFIPRFDRKVENGGVTRFAQESVASLTGMAGFGVTPSHDEVCRQIMLRCSKPQEEILEYIRRDIANLAFGNKDNHARNTALRRDYDGFVGLTPVYDFAPMYLHPDGIARRIRWKDNDNSQPEWAKVLDTVCAIADECGIALDRPFLKDGLRAMAPKLHEVSLQWQSLGIASDVYEFLKPGIARLTKELDEVN